MPLVGVLALQGDVREHVAALQRVGADVSTVRTEDQLHAVDALVIPGGESTAISHLLTTSGLREVLATRLGEQMPVFGTCAGLILLSSHIADGRSDQWSFSALDVSVRRNGYGRQVASFEVPLSVVGVGEVPGVFIRAPRIDAVGDDVEVLSSLDHGDGEHPVFVRQGNAWGCSFHPELTSSDAIHDLFVRSISN